MSGRGVIGGGIGRGEGSKGKSRGGGECLEGVEGVEG